MPVRPLGPSPVGRLVAAADFERVLGTRRLAITCHFSVHHLDASPAAAAKAATSSSPPKLSTIGDPASSHPVEDSSPAAPRRPIWVGAVVPKRHARRAVTRSLIKRQIYAAAGRHGDRLAPGLWIVRLRTPFDPVRFASAASPALRREARREIDTLLAGASARPGGPGREPCWSAPFAPIGSPSPPGSAPPAASRRPARPTRSKR
ncbi:MAG: ribonuclease P protein component [Caldimonas sp.]